MPNPLDNSNETYYVPPGVHLPGPTDAAWQNDAAKEYLRSKGIIDDRLGNGPLVKDSESDAIEKLANDLNLKLDDISKDYLYQYYLNEQSNKSAWERQMTFEKDKYNYMVEGLRKAGLNPFLALQGLSGGSASANSSTVQGGLYTSRNNQNKQLAGDVAGKIGTVIAIIAAAVIAAL